MIVHNKITSCNSTIIYIDTDGFITNNEIINWDNLKRRFDK